MDGSRFLASLIGASGTFAAVTYYLTGSFVQTVLCAVLVQVGHFLAMLYVVSRSEHSCTRVLRPNTQETQQRLSESSKDVSVEPD
ncbi:exopolysaccharide production repressor protein [Mesorhizobium sp. 128a]